jgi:protein TonB
MEPKKNPSKDIHKRSGVFFLIGLCLSISLTICAFEWTTIKPEVTACPLPDDLGMVLIDPTIFIYEPTAPQPIKNISKKIVALEQLVESSEPQIEGERDIFIDPLVSNIKPDIEIPIEPMTPEESEEPVVIAEKMPEPLGGYETYYKFLAKEVKYPRRAQRDEIQGRVYVQFIINKKGELQDLKVIKGIGYGCDEEALRIMALTKWSAGKQRGKPVNVKMVMPLQFKLQ